MRLRTRLTLFTTLFLAAVLIATALAVFAFTERSLVRQIEENLVESLQQVVEQDYGTSVINSLPSDSYFLVRMYSFKVDSPNEIIENGITFRQGEYPFEKRFGANQFLLESENRPAIRNSNHSNPSRADLFSNLQGSDLETLFKTGKLLTRMQDANGKSYIVGIKRDYYKVGDLRRPAYALLAIPFPGDILNSLKSLLLQTILIAFLVFAIGVYLLAGQVLTPVKNITRAAAQISGQDLSKRVPQPKFAGELNDLAVTINNMLERLQESFETQQRFTGYASHELRTPVTVIAGHANYLLRRSKLSEDQIDSLSVIHKEADRMAKLVNDLLELARADAGLNIKREPMNLVEVVEEVKNQIAPVADEIEIKLNVGEPLIEISGDANRLKQVVLNLVQNAINAGAKTITLGLYDNGKNVSLEVFDDGAGIPDDSIPHLFDRFYRVDGARSKRGSGLGLSIVKWIISQHEGNVEVESKVGEGSIFTITLPSLNPKTTEANMKLQSLWGKRDVL